MPLLFRRWRWLYLGVLIGMFAPIGALIMGWVIGSLAGCADGSWDESAAPDCPGGEWVYLLTVSSWYALFTVPAGSVALAVIALAHGVAWYRARPRHTDLHHS